MSQQKAKASDGINPETISRFKKERFLRSLSEKDFRDKVVRPLFLRMDHEDGRDLCGPDEQGKDCVFVEYDKMGMAVIIAVQTKKGNLTVSKNTHQNVCEAITQLRTALSTRVTLLAKRMRVQPERVYLCVSGKINDKARNHIVGEVADPRMRFMDANDLIPLIDARYPELWFGIDADKFPYLRKFMNSLLETSDTITLSEVGVTSDSAAPITDDMYVPLYLHRYKPKSVKRSGKVHVEPELESLPVQSVMKRREALIHLVGEAGSGKTTALRRLAYTLADRCLSSAASGYLPLLLRARDIATTDLPLLELLRRVTEPFTDTGRCCFTVDELRKGDICVLVDALDEAPPDRRASVVDRILAFHEEYPRCKVVLTSREYASIVSLPTLTGFTRLRLTPINLQQAEKILDRLEKGRKVSEDTSKEMLRRLHEVHGMDLSPLLVTVFVATSDYSRKDIPANITELFKKFTEMMLGRWDQRKGLAQQYQAQLKDFLLCELGFHMHSQQITEIPLAECREIFRSRLADTGHEADLDLLFEETVIRSGLFILDGDRVSFRHNLLQEFFAGRGVQSAAYFQNVIAEDWWKHAVVFYFGEHPSRHTELANLVNSLEQFEGAILYNAAVAIGLALQACYLSKVADKRHTMDWVIGALARAREGYLQSQLADAPDLPYTAFVGYYLYARDAVACDVFRDQAISNVESALGSPIGTTQVETEIFWNLVSLIETGYLEEARQLAQKFRPVDDKLLLALSLGAFFIANLETYSKKDKKTADAIHRILAPRVKHLRSEVMKEMTSCLLEVRRGDIKALPEPTQ
ncbi:NACHT domain-containing protein [bacterium]|nr:NACHT domain-containing protein [bacterium]